MQWHKGTLCPIRNERSIFIKPLNGLPEEYTCNSNKDVYMHADNISKYVLPLKGGDSVEFVLGDRNKEKPMARKVKVIQYSQRTTEELLEYIEKYTEDLKSTDSKKVLMETLSYTVMWSFLGSPTFARNGGLYHISIRGNKIMFDKFQRVMRSSKLYSTVKTYFAFGSFFHR